MTTDRPLVFILAGPNGAGKTTAAPYLVRDAMGIEEFVNADAIARGLSGFNPQQVDFAAGRIMLARLKELARRRASFAFETTLASRTFAPWLRQLREGGYFVELNYLWLPSAELARDRVLQRVRKGGHDVPAQTVRRRFNRGLRNLFELYQPAVDCWRVYGNSGERPRQIALAEHGRMTVVDEVSWPIITRQARKP